MREARAMYKQIALLDPNNTEVCLNLAVFQNGMANQAITWITRALEAPDVSDDEHHGLWYELALAYKANGEDEKAAKYFEKIYAEM